MRDHANDESSALSLLPGDIEYESPSGNFRFYFPSDRDQYHSHSGLLFLALMRGVGPPLIRSRAWGSGEDTMLSWLIDWPLTPPTQLTLLVSLLLAIFAALVHYVPLAVPHLHTGFTVLMLGYLVLLAGNVFRGL
jgi:hypothetical protein